ncbi:malonate decarboxylase subunit epsilon [Pokkaliibacter sp. MBI-7]|uniref:ACP S-malonyltransferase n=1 Tax=Pokkaliibacter sp. MBI-7 TaxID=3040600 RepID=UPI002449AC88|nr:malonate decarboxylase subunit epsilon [Pokkaliibacter sp. MBI-7]MDH2434420.1 malonate decarboxylase subunit epsilon [Pokkaliibacter sp. MBI-7]
MLTAFTFPGQGAQQSGMLQGWPDHGVFHQVQEEAESLLAQPLSDLDSAEALRHSRNVQLALLISGVAWARWLRHQGITADYVMGLSIGAYAAAVIADSLSFADALQLVSLRGELMQQAFPQGYGMLALVGASLDCVERSVAQLQAQQQPVWLANLNAGNQWVLAGRTDALQATATLVQQQESCAARLLEVSVPSHCPLLQEPAAALQQAVTRVEFSPPRCAYISAARARVIRKAEDIADDLAWNMARQVRWHAASQMLVERGIERVLEMPPGATLTSLFRRLLPQGQCLAVSSQHGFRAEN